MQDILLADDTQERADMQRYEVGAVSAIDLGTVLERSFKLTLRHACKRTIEATDVRSDWHGEVNFQRWTGNGWLLGSNRGSEWKLELNVERLAIAGNRYPDAVSGGVDQYRLYNYDAYHNQRDWMAYAGAAVPDVRLEQGVRHGILRLSQLRMYARCAGRICWAYRKMQTMCDEGADHCT